MMSPISRTRRHRRKLEAGGGEGGTQRGKRGKWLQTKTRLVCVSPRGTEPTAPPPPPPPFSVLPFFPCFKGLPWSLMWISRKMEKSHAAQLNYTAAQCKRSVLNYVREVAGPAAGVLEINHTNHPCMNPALEAATLRHFRPFMLFSSSCTHAF